MREVIKEYGLLKENTCKIGSKQTVWVEIILCQSVFSG